MTTVPSVIGVRAIATATLLRPTWRGSSLAHSDLLRLGLPHQLIRTTANLSGCTDWPMPACESSRLLRAYRELPHAPVTPFDQGQQPAP